MRKCNSALKLIDALDLNWPHRYDNYEGKERVRIYSWTGARRLDWHFIRLNTREPVVCRNISFVAYTRRSSRVGLSQREHNALHNSCILTQSTEHRDANKNLKIKNKKKCSSDHKTKSVHHESRWHEKTGQQYAIYENSVNRWTCSVPV